MEDVLDLYHEEYDRERPVVCFDETSKQLLGDVRPPVKAKPGRVERYDTEYQRNGTRNLFMFCEPKGGWRHVEVTGRRTAVDFAHRMKWLVDEAYPDATVIRLVLDNLNTHKPGSLYEAFAPSEARRIAKRLEFHHTPVHGSWLNMAEIELSVFSRQCLNRRIGDEALLRREVAALERERNDAGAIIDWRFSTRDARSKLGFAHFKPRRQANLSVGGTGRPGLSVYQGRRRTVKNPRTPATGAGAPGRWHPRRSATAWRTKPLCDGPRVVVAAADGPPRWSRRRGPSGSAWCERWPDPTTGAGSPRPDAPAPPGR